VPAHRKKASRSNAKHVRQERLNRRAAFARRANAARLPSRDHRRLFAAAGWQREPLGCRLPRQRRPDGPEDQFALAEIDDIVIVIRGPFMDRAFARAIIPRLVMMAWGMASRRTVGTIIMAMAMVMTMRCQMNMSAMGMPRRFSLCLVDVWHGNSPQEQLGSHQQEEETTHDPPSLTSRAMQRQSRANALHLSATRPTSIATAQHGRRSGRRCSTAAAPRSRTGRGSGHRAACP